MALGRQATYSGVECRGLHKGRVGSTPTPGNMLEGKRVTGLAMRRIPSRDDSDGIGAGLYSRRTSPGRPGAEDSIRINRY